MQKRSTTTVIDGPPSHGTDDDASKLDRRRKKLRSAKEAAASTTADLDAIDRRLDHKVDQAHLRRIGLKTALKQVTIAKKTIKDAKATDGELRAERKQARRRAAKAAKHADTAEAKYDAAVLADMLRREKANDLSEHAAPGTSSMGDEL